MALPVKHGDNTAMCFSYLMSRFMYWSAPWLLALSYSMALAAPVIDLNPAKQPIALGDASEYWIDAGAQEQPDQIINNPNIAWTATPERGIYPLKPTQALWIKFAIPPSQNAERWLLEIPYPALDHASLFTVQQSGKMTEQKAGDLLAVNSWVTPHRHALMMVSFDPQQPTQYLLRLDNAQGFSAPIRFVNARFVLRSEQKLSLFLGFSI